MKILIATVILAAASIPNVSGTLGLECLLPNLVPLLNQTWQTCPAYTDTSMPTVCPTASTPCVIYNDFAGGRTAQGNTAHANGLLPPWVNLDLAKRGQQFIKKNFAAVTFAQLFGLMVSAFPDAMDVLMFTGASNSTPNVQKRYMATISQMMVWYDDCMWDANGNTDFVASIVGVRQRHIAAAAAAANAKANSACGCIVPADMYDNVLMTTAFRSEIFADLEASNVPAWQRIQPATHWTNITAVPMNQQIQALTQFAFSGFTLLFPDRFGMSNATPDELWAFNHFWAVIGYAMGIDDKYNLGLQPDLTTAKQYYQKLFDEYQIPAIFLPTYTQKVFAEKTLVGIAEMMGVLNLAVLPPNAVLVLVCDLLVGIPCPRTKALLTLDERARYEGFKGLLATNYPLESNTIVYQGVNLLGVQYFGPSYLSRYCKARNAYFAYYGN